LFVVVVCCYSKMSKMARVLMMNYKNYNIK
jgi:hypothetical protein